MAQDVSICNPYRVRSQESELSCHQRFGTVPRTLEKDAGLTLCIARRGASLTGSCVQAAKTPEHEVEVGVSSRMSFLLSGPSFRIIRRPSRALGGSSGPRRHLNHQRGRLSLCSVSAHPGDPQRAGMGGADSHHFIDHGGGPLSRRAVSVGACGGQVSRERVVYDHHERAAVDGKVDVGRHAFACMPTRLVIRYDGWHHKKGVLPL